jgi:hypothetical protein
VVRLSAIRTGWITVLTPDGNFVLCHYCIQWAIISSFLAPVPSLGLHKAHGRLLDPNLFSVDGETRPDQALAWGFFYPVRKCESLSVTNIYLLRFILWDSVSFDVCGICHFFTVIRFSLFVQTLLKVWSNCRLFVQAAAPTAHNAVTTEHTSVPAAQFINSLPQQSSHYTCYSSVKVTHSLQESWTLTELRKQLHTSARKCWQQHRHRQFIRVRCSVPCRWQYGLRPRLRRNQNRHNTTVWTDSRQWSTRNHPHYCLCQRIHWNRSDWHVVCQQLMNVWTQQSKFLSSRQSGQITAAVCMAFSVVAMDDTYLI